MQTWKGDALHYYAQGSTFAEANTSVGALLASTNLNGQCTAFVPLLLYAAWANGVQCVSASATAGNSSDPDNDSFMIRNWTFSTNTSFSFPYEYKLTFFSTEDDMVQGNGGSDTFGEVTSGGGISGQGVATPSQKIFKIHQLVKFTAPSTTDAVYFDPSYGQSFTNEWQFEAEAVAGYVSWGAKDVDNPAGFTNLVLRARPVFPNEHKIQFSP